MAHSRSRLTRPRSGPRLVDDAAIFPPGNADLADAAAAYVDRRGDARTPTSSAPFVLRDTDVPKVAVAPDVSFPVSVVVTGGAGQIAGPATGAATRSNLTLAGMEIALRDLDDLAGNARRVVAAVDAARAEGDLDDDVPVYVELPPGEPTHQWLAAADEVAAAELRLKFRTGGRGGRTSSRRTRPSRGLDRRRPRPGDPVQVHGRAPSRRAATPARSTASSTTASSTSCWRPGGPLRRRRPRRRGRRDPRAARPATPWPPRRRRPTSPAPGAGSRRSAPARSASRSTT